MMIRKADIHTEIEELLIDKNSLWPDELERVENHLQTCEQCRNYAAFLDEMSDRKWNPHLAEKVTQQQKQEVLKMIELNRKNVSGTAGQNVPRLGRIFALLAVILVVGAVSFLIFDPGLEAPDALSGDELDVANVAYDGWEMGVAYDYPEEWTYQKPLVIDGFKFGNGMAFSSKPLSAEEILSPWDLDSGETRALITVKNPIFDLSGDPELHMREFSLFFNGPAGTYEMVEFANRPTYFLKSSYLDRDYIDATFFVGNRLARIYIEGKKDDDGNRPNIEAMAASISLSMVELSYGDWRSWEHPDENVALTIPKDTTISFANFGPNLELFDVTSEHPYQWQFQFSSALEGVLSVDEYFEFLENNDPRLEKAELVESPADFRSITSAKMALYKLENGDYLLLATLVNPDRFSEVPTSQNSFVYGMTLQTDMDGLMALRPMFELVFRSMRTKTVPLITPDVQISDPNYGAFIVTPNGYPQSIDYGTEMLFDFNDIEIEIDSVVLSEDSTKISFFLNDFRGRLAYGSVYPFEGYIEEESGEVLPYECGSFSSAGRVNNDTYNPPNELVVSGLVDLSPSSKFTMSTSLIVYYIGATHNIDVNLTDRDWGDKWFIRETTYFNGLAVNFYEASLDEEAKQLRLIGTVNGDNVPVGIQALYQTGNSQAKFKLEGDRVVLLHDLTELPSEPLSLYLEATVQYENAVSTTFEVGENGDIILAEN